MVGLRFVSSSLRRIVQVLLKSEHYPNLKPFFFSRSLTKHPEGSKPVPHSKDDLLFLFQDQIFQKRCPSKSHKIILPNICYMSVYLHIFPCIFPVSSWNWWPFSVCYHHQRSTGHHRQPFFTGLGLASLEWTSESRTSGAWYSRATRGYPGYIRDDISYPII